MQVRMFYTVYKITNLINNKIYIGTHKTNNLEDSYMGSGSLIIKAIIKYDLSNFKKEYLAIFDNPEQMFELESTVVNNEFLKRSDVYNLIPGGKGLDGMGGSIAGSWQNKEKRLEIWKTVPLKDREKIGKTLGDKFGGLNRLSNADVIKRLQNIEDINLMEYGWVKKVSERLNITHTQSRRFIEKHYKGPYKRRKT